jgi:hypothetical protein
MMTKPCPHHPGQDEIRSDKRIRIKTDPDRPRAKNVKRP